MEAKEVKKCPRCGGLKKLVQLWSEDEGVSYPIGCKECRYKQVKGLFGIDMANFVRDNADD